MGREKFSLSGKNDVTITYDLPVRRVLEQQLALSSLYRLYPELRLLPIPVETSISQHREKYTAAVAKKMRKTVRNFIGGCVEFSKISDLTTGGRNGFEPADDIRSKHNCVVRAPGCA